MSDYISREQALDSLAEYVVSGFAESTEDLQGYTDAINNIPSADVRENIHGEWIELPKAFDPNENPCECSKCGHILSFMHGYPKSNFCPNCGSDNRTQTYNGYTVSNEYIDHQDRAGADMRGE